MRAWLLALVGLLGSSGAFAQAQPEIPAGLRCLQRAYPQQVCQLRPNAAVLCDGTELAYDDGQLKTHARQLEQPDLQDMFAQPYPQQFSTPPGPDVEPGRVRYLPLLDAMYGDSARAVRARLTRVTWLPSVSGGKVEITTANGVDQHLQAVSDAIERLPLTLRRVAAHTSGTFNDRTIAGTDRKSAHSYGIAIDVAPALADYWRWREPRSDPPQRYRNRLPLEIVQAFEREGFIWGGRWSHYDTMHFEYRPELLVDACRAVSSATASPPTPAAPAVEHYAWSPHATDTLLTRFAPPPGFTRVPLGEGSFGAWLRTLPLREGRGEVRLHDGSLKDDQRAHAAVIDIDVGKRDLQQCADAVMRMRAEFLFSQQRAEQVCFRAANGQRIAFAQYLREHPARGYAAFRRYLDGVFGVANSASLFRELVPVTDPRAIEPGDVYIEPAHGGGYGHAVLVLDVARNTAGEPRFLIAQSYMPAQDFHVLRNQSDPAQSPWYAPALEGSLSTPEWEFPAGSLRRFDRACK